jgi:hypothetical protein
LSGLDPEGLILSALLRESFSARKDVFSRHVAVGENAENLRSVAHLHIEPLRQRVATFPARCAHRHGRAMAAIVIVSGAWAPDHPVMNFRVICGL